MANLAVTACTRCREQKLRCSREQPECERCLRLCSTCTYPAPPDRKLIAATRKPPKRKKVDEPAETPSTVPSGLFNDNTQSGPNISSGRSAWLRYAQIQAPSPVSDQDVKDPESPGLGVDVQAILLDVYFTCTFNSPLVFHRPTFDREYAAGLVPQHMLLAAFALATNFLQPEAVIGRPYAQQLQHLGDLAAVGQQWALSAGRHVLQTVDLPKLSAIQTCQILALYWFSRGDTSRNTMFSAISFRAIRTLILEVQSGGSLDDKLGWVQAETMRRSFWAGLLVYSINSDHYMVGSSSDVFASTLPLPCSEAAFLRGKKATAPSLSQIAKDAKAYRLGDEAGEPSIFGELMRLLNCWARIRDHIEGKRYGSDRHQLASLFALHDDLASWASDLPPSLAYSKRNLYEQLFVKKQPIYIAIHAMHFQCRLTLHSSVVPQFSGVELPKNVPVEAVRVCAEVALKAAQGLSQLGADVLALEWDSAQVAPFVGYCMYVASSVHMTVLSRDHRLEHEARKNLAHSLKMLKAMKPFWNVLDRLWERVQILYEAQMAETHDASPQDDGAQQMLSNILDKSVATRRNTEGLAEPLEDSVLQYTLQGLNHKPTIPSPEGARQLDNVISTQSESIDALLQSSNSISATISSTHNATTMPMDLQSHQQAVDPILLPPEAFDIDQNILPFGLDPGSDWWQMPWDEAAQMRMSFDDFFGLSGRM